MIDCKPFVTVAYCDISAWAAARSSSCNYSITLPRKSQYPRKTRRSTAGFLYVPRMFIYIFPLCTILKVQSFKSNLVHWTLLLSSLYSTFISVMSLSRAIFHISAEYSYWYTYWGGLVIVEGTFYRKTVLKNTYAVFKSKALALYCVEL